MKRQTLLLAMSTVLATACAAEYELVEGKDAQDAITDDSAPDIEVDPTSIDFGDVYAYDSTAGAPPPDESTAVVTITNVGEGDLRISDLALETGTAFTLGAISSVAVAPGGSATFTVTFAPETADEVGDTIFIESNDPDEGVVEIPLTGNGIAPRIDVSPSDYDFGTLYIGCDGEQAITISNVGNADLVVDSFEFNTASTDLDFDAMYGSNGDLPWTISPGGSVEVYVDYAPYDEYADQAYLFVNSNDPYQPQVLAAQEGLGELYGTNVDIYEQPIKGETDIIFAVDRSCSMNDDITNVQNNFGTFVTTMASLDADYHVAATVEDSGCINGSDLWIDKTFSASDAQSTITTMINLGASYGSNTERAFMLLEACLAESVDGSGSPDPGGCNYGLVRENASLNLIGVSDEPEQSVNNYSYYVSLFQSLKGNPDDVVMHAIGGDYPSGCGSASAYTGFYEATVATGGLFLSICASDWGSYLEALAEGSAADLSTFELTDWPVPETIEVRIDGVTTTVGWEYNATDNAIDFESDDVPEGGSTIEISYALYGDCDQ
jgi:hypothetical protein